MLGRSGRVRMRALTAAIVVLTAGVFTAPAVAAAEPGSGAVVRAAAGRGPAAGARYVPAGCAKAVKADLTRDASPQARCFAYGLADSTGKLVVRTDAPPETALGPAELREAYQIPDGGDGMTVAIVDAGGYAKAEADLQVFRSHYGLPECGSADGCFTKLDQRGGTDYPAENPGWSVETALDLDAVSAVCPKCRLVLVEADSALPDDLAKAALTASEVPGVVAISNSYGVPGESPAELDYDHYYSHPGIAVTAASGDYGWLTSWPATNPDVIAVGGTTLTADDSPRGWRETVWSGAGSGCSEFEPKPGYQADVDTGCDKRAITDVSADADPATGIGIYNTSGEAGWAQYGGTSLAAPLIAAMYALGGKPAAGSNPASFPYTDFDSTAHFWDVTDGSNGSCGGVLCTGGAGWDGPTGIGTPHGIAGLTRATYGSLTGTVTNGSAVIAGATVTAVGADGSENSATTDAAGVYKLAAPAGTYRLTARAFGYAERSVPNVELTTGGIAGADFDLPTVPSHTVSGTVTDGSGHGWPMYAEIKVDGAPGSVFTDPYTGTYTLSLPENTGYTLHVTSAELQGYRKVDRKVQVGSANLRADFALPVDVERCIAGGYEPGFVGAGEEFQGWTGATPQDGWTLGSALDGEATWRFDDPGHRGNLAGGKGNFAVIDSDNAGFGHAQDTSLVSPVVDLGDVAAPSVNFDTYYSATDNSVADVDISLDGGATWATVWNRSTKGAAGHQIVPVPQAAHQHSVQVRFHYTGAYSWYWEVDGVTIGNETCTPLEGGLIAGAVKDGNTRVGLAGAAVHVEGDAAAATLTRATPDDPAVADGFYELYVPAGNLDVSGNAAMTVRDGRYTPGTGKVAVAADQVARKNWTLKAGHLTVSADKLSITEQLGAVKSKTLTLGNDGTEPVHVTLAERGTTFTPMSGGAGKGAPLTKIAGDHPMGALPANRGRADTTAGVRSGAVAGDAWTPVADLPRKLMDNAAVTLEGRVYTFGGTDGDNYLAGTYVYDADAGSWTQLADMPQPLEKPVAQAVDGLVYVFGGWSADGGVSDKVYRYDPADNSWRTVAPMPAGVAAPGTAVLDGKIYVMGGCRTGSCEPGSHATQVYNPLSDVWSQAADYPVNAAWMACAGLEAGLYCAGGSDSATTTEYSATYSYDPHSNHWTQRADMPYSNWGMVSTHANGKLQVAQGIAGGFTVNTATEYDPATDAWSALPNANNALYRGAGACGFYSVGGSVGGFIPVATAEELPGYGECIDTTDTPWLSIEPTSLDIAPGQTVAVTVTMDSGKVDQPGTYTSGIAVSTDSPYPMAPVTTTMTASPPASWAKITGTVKDSSGAALGGVTVQVCTMYIPRTGTCGPVSYTLSTQADGRYQLWLASGYTPLQLVAAKDGYQPKTAIVKLTKGATVTTNFTLPAK